MPMRRKIPKNGTTDITDFINQGGEPDAVKLEEVLVKKTFFLSRETSNKLELLKAKMSAERNIYQRELVDEALQDLFKKYGI